MGCLIAFVLLPFTFLKWCFTSGWKGIIVLVIVLALLIAGYVVIRGEIDKQINPPKPASETAIKPSIQSAPFIVQTTSRTYYSSSALKDGDGNVTMVDYWEFNKGEWKLTKGVLVLDVVSYGQITIKER